MEGPALPRWTQILQALTMAALVKTQEGLRSIPSSPEQEKGDREMVALLGGQDSTLEPWPLSTCEERNQPFDN